MSGQVADRSADVLERIADHRAWRHRIEIAPGVVTPGREDCRAELRRIRFPASLVGRRVLDVGCSDGFYSFEAERRGATEVVALDDESSLLAGTGNGFQLAAEALDSKVRYEIGDVHGLSPSRVGTFDTIVFLKVLYHLRNPSRRWTRCALSPLRAARCC